MTGIARYSLLLRTKFTKWSNLYSFMAKDGRARLQPCRIPPQRGERSLAGGERSEPPDNSNNDTHPGRGCRSSPLPCRGALSRRHGFQGFAKSAHPWLSSSRSSGAVGTEVVACSLHIAEPAGRNVDPVFRRSGDRL